VGLALAALVTGTSLAAQTEVDVGIHGGWSIPTQDAANLYVAGYNIGGNLRYMPGTSVVGLQLDGSYHKLNRDQLNNQDLGLEMLVATASIVWPVQLEASPIVPYVLGGGGIASLKVVDPRTITPYENKVRFVLTLGGGVEFRGFTSSFAPFIDFRLLGILGPDPRETAYLTLNAGAKLIFGGARAKARKRNR
jgi:opacity protein-like surface antigen